MSETQNIQFRLERIYDAVGKTVVEGLGEIVVKSRNTESLQTVEIRAFADKSNAELENRTHQVNHLIASFHDHLRGWAKRHGRNPNDVSAAADASVEMKVVRDLDDNEKHGGKPRDGGRSKSSPRIECLETPTRLTSSEGRSVRLIFTPEGLKQVGTGTVGAVITGRVVGGSGKLIGKLDEIQKAALSVWEKLLADWDLLPADD